MGILKEIKNERNEGRVGFLNLPAIKDIWMFFPNPKYIVITLFYNPVSLNNHGIFLKNAFQFNSFT